MIRHLNQFKDYSCGAMCYAMLFGVSEGEAILACRTKRSGTSHDNLLAAIKQKLPAHLADISRDWDEYKDTLRDNSRHFPVIISGIYHRQGKRGRCRKDYHASLVVDGVVYDPAENNPIDMDAYEIAFNKGLTIRSIIIVDREVEGYGQSR